MSKYKPIDAGIDEKQMDNIRDKYNRDQRDFWSKIESIKLMHVNDFYRTFVELEGKDCMFELKVVDRGEFERYEYLGCNVFKG